MIFEHITPSEITDADVSSQDDSIPKIFILIKIWSLIRKTCRDSDYI
jgi:hypothetical protein